MSISDRKIVTAESKELMHFYYNIRNCKQIILHLLAQQSR